VLLRSFLQKGVRSYPFNIYNETALPGGFIGFKQIFIPAAQGDATGRTVPFVAPGLPLLKHLIDI
jgi:hypothetical protein